MMSLLDDLEALPVRKRCATCAWYEARTEQERAKFDDYLAAIRAGLGNYAALHDVCTSHGLVISPKAFRDHCNEHVV